MNTFQKGDLVKTPDGIGHIDEVIINFAKQAWYMVDNRPYQSCELEFTNTGYKSRYFLMGWPF